MKNSLQKTWTAKTEETFKAHKVVYNRNGISGRAFWSVAFSYEEGNMFKPNMLAVLPYEGKAEECCVVDMNDVEGNWRGPNFYEYVLSAIEEHRNNR